MTKAEEIFYEARELLGGINAIGPYFQNPGCFDNVAVLNGFTQEMNKHLEAEQLWLSRMEELRIKLLHYHE